MIPVKVNNLLFFLSLVKCTAGKIPIKLLSFMNSSSTRNHKFEPQHFLYAIEFQKTNKKKVQNNFSFTMFCNIGGIDIQSISNTCSKMQLYNFKFQK